MLWEKSQSNTAPKDITKLNDGRIIVTRNVKNTVTEKGNIIYEYEERVMSNVEYVVYATLKEQEDRREAEIIDEYTMQLIQEGVL